MGRYVGTIGIILLSGMIVAGAAIALGNLYDVTRPPFWYRALYMGYGAFLLSIFLKRHSQ